jgi:hypothetical protein
MGREFSRNLFRFVLLILAQILFFSQINFSPFINPYVYPLFILLLPFQLSRQAQLILGFLMGFFIDLFLDSSGMHTAAAVFLAYLRPWLINLITPKGTEFEVSPNVHSQGLGWFLMYLLLAITGHHVFYFIIETAGFYNLFFLLLKITLSSFASVGFMLMLLYMFSKNPKRG